MRKYLTVFSIDWQNQFIYRLNFILWRLRNVLRLLMTYYLWTSIFATRSTAFGYSQHQILAYVFLSLFISSLVLAAPSNDHVGGEIGSGDLSNFLVKPINYLKYWFTRDVSSKLLNIIFATIEVCLLALFLRPQLSLSSSPVNIFLGLALVIIANATYFCLTKVAVFVAFWTPENTRGFMFVILVFVEILSGLIFPLDILPLWAYQALQFTPFPYLLYFPLAVLVGKIPLQQSWQLLFQSLVWLSLTWYMARRVWHSGLKIYSASGR